MATDLLDFWFEPAEFSVKIGASQQVKLMGKFKDGSTRDISTNMTYLGSYKVANNGNSAFSITDSGMLTPAANIGRYTVKAWGNIAAVSESAWGYANYGSMSPGASQAASSSLSGYPVWSAFNVAQSGGNSSHWAPASAKAGGSMSGWIGVNFSSPTKINYASFEPTSEYPVNVSHSFQVLVNGVWQTIGTSGIPGGVFGQRYKATIGYAISGFRINISGYSSTVNNNGPWITVREITYGADSEVEMTVTKTGTLVTTGFPNRINLDTKGNPADTEYLIQGSANNTFTAPYNVLNWGKQGTAVDQLVNETLVRYYRAKARNRKGVETDWSNIGRVGFLAPANFKAAAIRPTEIDLVWDPEPGAVSYELKRGTTVIYTGAAPNFTDTALSSDTSYSYTVVAKAGTLTSPSSSVTVATISVPILNLSSSIKNKVSLYWTWTANSADTVYVLLKDGVEVYRGNLRNYDDTNVTLGTVYRYQIQAIKNGATLTSNEVMIKVSDLAPMYHYEWDQQSAYSNATFAQFNQNLSGIPVVPAYLLRTGSKGGTGQYGTTASGIDAYIMVSAMSAKGSYVDDATDKLIRAEMYPLWPDSENSQFLLSGGLVTSQIVMNAGLKKYKWSNPEVFFWSGSGGISDRDGSFLNISTAPKGPAGNLSQPAVDQPAYITIYYKLVARDASGITYLGAPETPWMKTIVTNR